jgi:hypothetical protein
VTIADGFFSIMATRTKRTFVSLCALLAADSNGCSIWKLRIQMLRVGSVGKATNSLTKRIVVRQGGDLARNPENWDE